MSRQSLACTIEKQGYFVVNSTPNDTVAFLSSAFDIITSYSIRTHLRSVLVEALGLNDSIEGLFRHAIVLYQQGKITPKLSQPDLLHISELVKQLFTQVTPKGYYFGLNSVYSQPNETYIGWFKTSDF